MTPASRAANEFHDAGHRSGDMLAVPHFELPVGKRALEHDLEVDVIDDRFVDVENDGRRQVLSVCLTGHGRPGGVGDKSCEITLCDAIHLSRQRFVVGRVFDPEMGQVFLRRISRHLGGAGREH